MEEKHLPEIDGNLRKLQLLIHRPEMGKYLKNL